MNTVHDILPWNEVYLVKLPIPHTSCWKGSERSDKVLSTSLWWNRKRRSNQHWRSTLTSRTIRSMLDSNKDFKPKNNIPCCHSWVVRKTYVGLEMWLSARGQSWVFLIKQRRVVYCYVYIYEFQFEIKLS